MVYTFTTRHIFKNKYARATIQRDKIGKIVIFKYHLLNFTELFINRKHVKSNMGIYVYTFLSYIPYKREYTIYFSSLF